MCTMCPEAATGEVAKHGALPQSLEDLYYMMRYRCPLPQGCVKLEDYSPDIQKVLKYVSPAVEVGRLLNEVMVMMAGQSGAGKSSTINYLFNEELCPTSSSKSSTEDVTAYGKELCVTAESPFIKGFLSFADVPGSLDVEQSKEALNIARITKFREEYFADRKDLLLKVCKVNERVYPNLVLFAVKSTDNRMEGEDSRLRKSLKFLDRCSLIDRNVNNLIVVVTHAMSLPRAADAYKHKCAKIVDHIKTAVSDELQICNVKVVFVENKPEDYCMVKAEGCDFYKLPDGQLSHYNLIQAIIAHFKQHDDYLGRLLCGWYFADNCPEKKQKLQLLHSIQHRSVSKEELKQAQESLGFLNPEKQERKEDKTTQEFPFLYLGRGYCPITESTRSAKMYSETDTKIVTILGKTYMIPKFLQVAEKNEMHYSSLSSETRDGYQKNRAAKYGLEANIVLVVDVDSRGRWVKNRSATKNNSVVSILYETSHCNVRIEEPESNMKPKLSCAIKKLPSEFNNETANSFVEFFSKWGSHFICEVQLGGCFKADYAVDASSYTDAIGGELMSNVKSFVSYGATAGFSAGLDLSNKSFESKYNQDGLLTICGGSTLHAMSLTELVSKMESWLDSIPAKPAELQYSFKLCPYYNLVDGECSTVLRVATLAYLNSTIIEKIRTTRNRVSGQIVLQVAEEVVKTHCFSPFSTVCTKNGIVAFKDLKLGDDVLTVNCISTLGIEKWSCNFTKMYAYVHYDSEIVANFFVIHLENGQSLTVTGDHLVFRYDNGRIEEVRAKHLKTGDNLICVIDLNHASQNVKPVEIIEISRSTIQGVYSPLTYNGKLFVNGSLVSCYANIDSHAVAHASMAPLRLWTLMRNMICSLLNYGNGILMQVRSPFFTSQLPVKPKDQSSSGIHQYAKFLMSMRRFVLCKLLKA